MDRAHATATAEPARLEALDAAMKRYRYQGDALLEILHLAQELFGFLPAEVLVHVARALRLPPSRVYGVATFYNLFTLEPRGAHTCTVCLGTACYVNGAGRILEEVEKARGVRAGATAPDGSLSVAVVRCVGACGLAPVVVFDRAMAGRQTAESAVDRVSGWSRP